MCTFNNQPGDSTMHPDASAIRQTSRALYQCGLALLLLPLLVVGCDTTATQPESQVVVEAYLRAEAPFPSVRLSRTVDVSARYDPVESGVQGAAVAVERLSADSTVVETIPFEEGATPGRYVPTTTATVKPETTYRLRVQTSDGTTVTSTTTVPDSIGLVEVENETTRYQSEAQPAFTIEPPRPLTGRQNVYTFTTTSLLDFERTPTDSLRASLTPFYADGFDPEEDTLASLRVNSSGLLNEGNFQRNDDGTITVDLPWIAVAFYGLNEVAINVVDDNYYDLLRSEQAQEQSFAPGEIPNVIDHVEGGTGVFGSYAQAAHPVSIQPPARSEDAPDVASNP